MNEKLQNPQKTLAQRREQLIAQSAQQREQLAHIAQQWRAPLSLADKGLALIGLIKQHPILAAGSSVLLLKLLRQKRIGKWIGRGFAAWQIIRKLHSKFLAYFA